MSEKQYEIPGIGQQKANLSDWKKENDIYTHHAPHMEESPWCCWSGDPNPVEILESEGDDAFGFGMTESAAIVDYCTKFGIKKPFWWT